MAKNTETNGGVVKAGGGKPKRIAGELRDLIISGHLDEGDLLGTEADLLDRFGVSRPSLRESLRILEAEGLISVVRGALGGVVVHRPDQRTTARAAALVLQSRSVSLADVFDASAVIEPAAARMVAASRGHERAANELRQLVIEQKRTAHDTMACNNAIIAFHTAIVRLSGNQTLVLVCEMLNEVIGRAIADVLTRGQQEPAGARQRRIRTNEQLVEFIATGDGEGAQAHWSNHFVRLRRSLLREHGASTIELMRYR